MRDTAETKPGDQDQRELALLKRIAQRDKDAISDLYQLYHPRLFKFVFRLTHSYAAADELVNDIMLIVWQQAAGFRGDSKVSTWIFGIAYRQAIRSLTRGRKAPAQHGCAEEPTYDDSIEVETRDWVWRGLHTLPYPQQLSMVLVFYYGLSYAETAQIAGCSVNTIKTRMFHARRKLRDYFAEAAIDNAMEDGRQHG
ncbi:MAG TPA: RNA polymerase sigma factor [Woeseiaceae bacterium]|nr:RNA polymerase sigma factor [Woeseiaceae bacterium]